MVRDTKQDSNINIKTVDTSHERSDHLVTMITTYCERSREERAY